MFKIEFSNVGAFDRAADYVREMRERLVDLEPLGRAIRASLIEGFTRMLAEGVDNQGRKLAPLAESTVGRRGHRDEPLRPNGANPILDSLLVEVVRTRGNEIRVGAYFTHPAAKFTAEGTRNQPARNALAPSAEMLEAVQAIIDDHVGVALEGGLIQRF